jgi:tRNA threonylcarbamoyladenosine biosynthesis protein TsaE
VQRCRLAFQQGVENHASGNKGSRLLSAWHFDFYRFDDPQEWEDAGFRDMFASPGLKIAEWPEKADGLLPMPDLRVRIVIGADDVRQVTLDACTERGRELLA